MTLAKLFRPTFDRRGDPVTGDKTPLGLIQILEGGAAPTRIDGKQETASTEGMIGVWEYQDSGLDVRSGDRLEFGEQRYIVVGNPLWRHEHSFSGTDTLDDMYWVKVEART